MPRAARTPVCQWQPAPHWTSTRSGFWSPIRIDSDGLRSLWAGHRASYPDSVFRTSSSLSRMRSRWAGVRLTTCPGGRTPLEWSVVARPFPKVICQEPPTVLVGGFALRGHHPTAASGSPSGIGARPFTPSKYAISPARVTTRRHTHHRHGAVPPGPFDLVVVQGQSGGEYLRCGRGFAVQD